MNVTTERLDNCQVNVIVEMDAADIDKKLRQTARKISRQFNVPGYRRGKAPYNAVVRVFGREAIQQEALDEFGQDLYEQALEEVEYEAYQQGELQDVEWDPFRMTVLLPIQPELELGDYHTVRVPYEPETISDERVDEYLAGVQEEHAQWVPADRPAELDDQVVIDAEGKIDDEIVLSNEGYEMTLDAEADYPLPGFHKEIVGMSAGEDNTFALTYPEEDFEEDVAGKEATFTVHLTSIKEEDLPPLDDDLAMMVGDYETLEDLRASVQEALESEAAQKAESDYVDGVLEAMIESADRIEYPPQAIDREVELALEQMERNLATSGIKMEAYLGMLGKSREAYSLELRPAAEERLKKRLVMVEVAQLEEIQPTDEEIEAEIDRMSEAVGENADQMRQVLESPQGRMSVADDLIGNKVTERIVAIAKGEVEDEALEAEDEAEAEDKVLEAEDEAETEPDVAIEVDAEADADEAGKETEEDAEAEADAAGEETEEDADAEAEGSEET